jgi:hypothetical protein
MGTLSAGLPWVTLSESVRGLVGSFFWVKIVILLLFVTSSVLAKRPFCRAACPLGAIFSFFNRGSFLQLAWNPDTCTEVPEDLPGGHPARLQTGQRRMSALPRLHPLPEPETYHRHELQPV